MNRDVKPFVEKGSECGIRLTAGSDSILALGDSILCYNLEKKKRVIDDSAGRGFVQDHQQNVHAGAYGYQ